MTEGETAATAYTIEPQPGPQTALLACPVFEVFFGGARAVSIPRTSRYHRDGEHQENVLVTKLVANSGPRVGIERDGSARAADFRNTNQHFEGQNEKAETATKKFSVRCVPLLSVLSMAAKNYLV